MSQHYAVNSPADASAEPKLSALAVKLMAEYAEAENARQLFNERWLDDLRQYKGQYAPSTMAHLKNNKKSRVFYRMTTAKVNTMTGRLMDLLFPQRSKNWNIDPTPDPMIPEDVLMQELAPQIQERATQGFEAQMQELQAQGIMPDNLALMKLQAQSVQEAWQSIDKGPAKTRIAEERAAAMERVIDDQLKEAWANGRQRKSWSQHCRAVVQSACMYGMGTLKGPLVEKITTKRFVPQRNPDGSVAWSEEVYAEDMRPYYEAVSLWDIFPDPSALNAEQLRYVWQSHLYTDKDLTELANFPGFKGVLIQEHMRRNPEGDAQIATWESQMREINADNMGTVHSLRHRFRLYERWGYLSGAELREAGLAIDEADTTKIYASNVWILGNSIIKAAINPLEGVDIPYYFYPFIEDETAFFPEGIASLLRDPQAGMNSSVRSMQDNAAASSGPIVGVNMQALSEGEDPQDMQANKLFLFDKSGVNLSQAMQVISVPSCIEHNLSLAKFWQEASDEISTPRFNAGDGRISGAGQTASGLSMLMGASNIMLKDHVKLFDDCVCAPFIRAMFRWNMQWNPDDSIKGDFNIVAAGSQSLIAKEVRAQQIPGVLAMLANPAFAERLKTDQLLEVALEQTDLPAERILRSDEEAKEYKFMQMQQAALAQAQANVAALTQELERQGAAPEQIQQQLVAMLAAASGTAQQSQGASADMGADAGAGANAVMP